MLGATGLRDHPWPLLPRRIVTHVLRMAALQVGDPIADVVLMEPDDAARNGVWRRHDHRLGAVRPVESRIGACTVT